MVISASWISRMDSGHPTLNLRGVSTVIALASFLKSPFFLFQVCVSKLEVFTEYALWAKDLVFVISDGHLYGMQAFISEYHGVSQTSASISCARPGRLTPKIGVRSSSRASCSFVWCHLDCPEH